MDVIPPAGFSITNRNGKTHFPSVCLLEDEIEPHSIGEATVAHGGSIELDIYSGIPAASSAQR
jgi:hypothetical protein